jgi:hypothetical protein
MAEGPSKRSMWILAASLVAAGPATPAAPAHHDAHGPERAIVIRDVTLVDADAATTHPHRTAVVRGGRIERVDSAGEGAIAADAIVVDGRGKYLMPGLVDGHAHLATGRVIERLVARGEFPMRAGGRHEDLASFDRRILLSFLLNGVTTVVSFGSLSPEGGDDLELRDRVDRREILGPRLIVGDRIDGSTADHDGDDASTVDSPRTADDGRRRVLLAKQRGYDFIKPYTYLNKETYGAIVRTAKEIGLRTVGHMPELGCADCVTRDDAFGTPMDGIAHLEELATYALPGGLDPRDAVDVAERVLHAHQAVVTTLVTSRSIAQMYSHRCVPLPPREDLRYVDSFLLARWLSPRNRYLTDEFRRQPIAPSIPAAFEFQRRLARDLWARGVPLVVGTDATIPGVAYGSAVPDEMLELGSVGLPPADVLRAATRNAFQLLGHSDDAGTVSTGRRADLLLLRANPLEDLHNVRRIDGVMVNGRWFPIEALRRLADADARYYATLDRKLGLRRPTSTCVAAQRSAAPTH